MRQYSPYATPEVKGLLRLLSDKSTPQAEYREAFEQIGAALAKRVNLSLHPDDRVLMAASSEDADWLMRGIMDGLSAQHTEIAIFWNARTNPMEGDEAFDLAPVMKSYLEGVAQSDVLVICKSIIYTSCVVRTNIRYLLEKMQPKKIVVASPVMFKGAEFSLRNEFPHFGDRFQFVSFAVDDEQINGEVIPGIGGQVYARLGLGDSISKNRYIPKIVQERRALAT